MNDDSAVDLTEFQLFDPVIQQCPHAYYAEMQRSAPVFSTPLGSGSLHLVTRYHDVTEVVRDVATFSSRFDTAGAGSDPELARRLRDLYRDEGGYDRVGTMLTVDPPEHTRYRRLVTKAFTPKVIADLEPTIRAIAAQLVDDLLTSMERDGSVEFVEAFAVPLPVAVIAKALNVPDDRLADFKRWSDASIAGIGTNIGIEARVDAERQVIEFQKYFAEQLERRRTEPQDDILTGLLTARIDRTDIAHDAAASGAVDDEPLSMPEMLSIIQQLLVAGNETTTKMLTEMMRLLADAPDQWQRLRDDPSRAKAVVEETLRLSTPTQGMFRVVQSDTEVAGAPLAAGDRTVVMYAAANRDPAVFPDPDRFDPDRDNLTDHLAFGKGVHFCLGAALSRLEGKVAAEELARRLAGFELVDPGNLTYFPSFMLRGLVRLDMRVTAVTS